MGTACGTNPTDIIEYFPLIAALAIGMVSVFFILLILHNITHKEKEAE